MLLVTVLAAVAVTVATTVVLLLVEPTAPRSEAVRTGALSGGAVVALYALWLNDRRRRVEEARHDLEGEKIADERFARSVELLGNEADQVRVGALHSLAWLASSTPRYKQTVLDVLCAYLRRPFEHPELREARLDGGVSFHRTQFHGEVVLDGAVVATFLDISTTAPAGQLGTLLVGPQTRVDGNVNGWALAAP
jgi:hypothetical protein